MCLELFTACSASSLIVPYSNLFKKISRCHIKAKEEIFEPAYFRNFLSFFENPEDALNTQLQNLSLPLELLSTAKKDILLGIAQCVQSKRTQALVMDSALIRGPFFVNATKVVIIHIYDSIIIPEVCKPTIFLNFIG